MGWPCGAAWCVVGPSRLQYLFSDAAQLQCTSALEEISGSEVLVPPCDLLIAGFPCTDVSGLNPGSLSESTRRTIRDASKRTGSVFSNLVEYLRKHQPKLLVLENVTKLAAVSPVCPVSPLGDCLEMLEEAGYFVKVFWLDAYFFGFPVHRSRLYFAGMRKEYLEELGCTEDEVRGMGRL